MKVLRLMLVLILLKQFSFAQDTMMVYTLNDVSVIDFRVDHDEVFKNVHIDLNSASIGLEDGLEEAIQNSMPVYFKNYSYDGIASIDFRGTGAERTKVFWNGIPVNSPTLGSFDFSLIPSFLISEAKVRFGGASLVDGGGGLGGSVQLNNQNNFTKNTMNFIASYGSFGSYTGAFLGQFVKNKWSSDTRFLYHQAENDFSFVNYYKKDNPTEKRINNQLWRYALQQSFAYHLNANSSLELNFLYSHVDRNIPSSISSENEGTFQQDQLFFTQLAYNVTLKNNMFLKVRSSYQNQLNKFNDDHTDANNRVNAWNNKVDWGSQLSRSLSFNASLRYDLYFVDTYGTGYIQEQQYTAFAATDWHLVNALLVSGGIRFEGVDRDLSSPMPFLGMHYSLPQKWGSLKASATSVFRNPTINERYWEPGGNSELAPEQGWNYEASYLNSFELNKLKMDLELTGFYGNISDWILWYPSSELSSIWQAQNLWKVSNSGFELIASWTYELNAKSHLSLRILYSYNASHVIENKVGGNELADKQLILVPKNMLFIPLGIKIKDFSGGIDYSYTGLRYTDRLNKQKLDPYSLVDLHLTYMFFKQFNLTFRLNNILSQSYQTYPGQPMPGINFNIQFKWLLI